MQYFVFLSRHDDETYVGADPWPETETAEQAVDEVIDEILNDGDFSMLGSKGTMWVSETEDGERRPINYSIDRQYNVSVG